MTHPVVVAAAATAHCALGGALAVCLRVPGCLCVCAAWCGRVKKWGPVVVHKEAEPASSLMGVKQPLPRAFQARRSLHCMAAEASDAQDEGVGHACVCVCGGGGVNAGRA